MSTKTLLYAEDDKESRENYAYVLSTLFDTVYTAADGKEALEIYEERSPDVLLLDITMPGIDGLDLVTQIRRHDKKTHIVMLTAHSQRDRLLRAVNLKLDAYLIKPMDDELLLDAMRKIIKEMENENKIALINGLVWDKGHHLLTYEGKVLKTTKKETLLLDMLGRKAGSFFSRNTIILHVWSDETHDETHDHKLTQLIYRLNNKIATTIGEHEPLIENSYAYGYRINTA